MSDMPLIKTRTPNPHLIWQLEHPPAHTQSSHTQTSQTTPSLVHPLMARLFASRGVDKALDLDPDLKHLLSPETLLGMPSAAALLFDAIVQNKSICVVADYDCDGASACALAIKGLGMLGAKHLSYLVPDRVIDGYGLTPEISKRVASTGAQILITVDNGIASLEGVQVARELGLQVLITDHHLPAQKLPNANAIVNPNQPGCNFASKHLSGVGVMFYVLLGLRAHMRSLGIFGESAGGNSRFPEHIPRTQPKLDALLPLVALGSVADVVSLDANNRRLVEQGLRRIRALHMPVGLRCLFEVCDKDASKASAQDLGFFIGPRINAAGRLADMTIGIECLLSDSYEHAHHLAEELHNINVQRRSVEATMLDGAWEAAAQKSLKQSNQNHALCVFDSSFHEGVVGIVASRIKDRHHMPTFVFAPSQMSTAQGSVAVIKGSGRSIPGFHLRDALDWVSKQHPHLLIKFGGHAMAAGCTILEKDFSVFESSLSEVTKAWLGDIRGLQELWTDGELEEQYFNTEVVQTLQAQVWGQGFPAPLFCNSVEILKQRIVGEKHLSMKVLLHGVECDAIWFNHTQSLSSKTELVYKVELDTWMGRQKLKLYVEASK